MIIQGLSVVRPRHLSTGVAGPIFCRLLSPSNKKWTAISYHSINLEVWVKNTPSPQAKMKVTEAAFTYVAVDKTGKKQPVVQK